MHVVRSALFDAIDGRLGGRPAGSVDPKLTRMNELGETIESLLPLRCSPNEASPSRSSAHASRGGYAIYVDVPDQRKADGISSVGGVADHVWYCDVQQRCAA